MGLEGSPVETALVPCGCLLAAELPLLHHILTCHPLILCPSWWAGVGGLTQGEGGGAGGAGGGGQAEEEQQAPFHCSIATAIRGYPSQ